RALLDRFEGDESIVAELIAAFIKESPRMLGSIRDAMVRGDAASLARFAHNLKGSLGYFNSTEAIKAVSELERLGHDADFKKAAEVLPLVENYANGLRTQLSRTTFSAPQ